MAASKPPVGTAHADTNRPPLIARASCPGQRRDACQVTPSSEVHETGCPPQWPVRWLHTHALPTTSARSPSDASQVGCDSRGSVTRDLAHVTPSVEKLAFPRMSITR